MTNGRGSALLRHPRFVIIERLVEQCPLPFPTLSIHAVSLNVAAPVGAATRKCTIFSELSSGARDFGDPSLPQIGPRTSACARRYSASATGRSCTPRASRLVPVSAIPSRAAISACTSHSRSSEPSGTCSDAYEEMIDRITHRAATIRTRVIALPPACGRS